MNTSKCEKIENYREDKVLEQIINGKRVFTENYYKPLDWLCTHGFITFGYMDNNYYVHDVKELS